MSILSTHTAHYSGATMMHINVIIQPSVGADLSRPQPIYRPSRDVRNIPFNVLMSIISLLEVTEGTLT